MLSISIISYPSFFCWHCLFPHFFSPSFSFFLYLLPLSFLPQQLLKGQSRLKRLLSKERLLDSIGLLSLEPIGETSTDPDNPDSPAAPPLLIQTKTESVHVDVDCRDENGSTPLILAALNGHKDVVYTLLQYSANVHRKDTQGWVVQALSFPVFEERAWEGGWPPVLYHGATYNHQPSQSSTDMYWTGGTEYFSHTPSSRSAYICRGVWGLVVFW